MFNNIHKQRVVYMCSQMDDNAVTSLQSVLVHITVERTV